MNTFSFKLKIFDSDKYIDEFVLTSYSNDKISKIGILSDFSKFMPTLEYIYIVNKIYDIMKNNSTIYKLKENYKNICVENNNITYLYNLLVSLNNNEYAKEVELFNKTRTKFLETYTGEILLDNDYFQPYEYLVFIDSKTFKHYYYTNDNFRGLIDKYYFSTTYSPLLLKNYKEYPIFIKSIKNNNDYKYVIEKI